LYDVTLLEREPPAKTRNLDGETAEAVAAALGEAGFDGASGGSFDEADRQALEAFRGANNFENHSLDLIEDALARGWDDTEGAGETRLVNAVWHGLSRLDRA